MLARLQVGLLLFLLCAGCSTLKNPAQTGLIGSGKLALSNEDIAFSKALAHYCCGLICQDSISSDTGETARDFSTAIDLDPERTRLYPSLAVVYLFQKRTDKAIEVLEKACRNNPKSVQARIDLAATCEKAGRIDDAIKHFNRAITLAPEMTQLYRQLSLIYFQQKRNNEAFSLIKKGLKHAAQPADITAFCYNFAKLYEAVGLDDNALKFYTLAASSGSKWPDPFVRMAAIYTRTDIPMAIKTLNKALNEIPDNPKLLFFLGLLYSSDKKFDKAIEVFRKTEQSVDSTKTDGEKTLLTATFYVNYGSAYERSGQLKKAEEIFSKCLAMYPDNHEVLNYLSYMWAEQGVNLEQGLKNITRALEIDPDNGAYIDTLGWIYFKQKDYKKALEQTQKACQLVKDDPTILDHLGDIFAAMNNKAKAIDMWKQSLQLDPESKTVADKLDKNGVDSTAIRKSAEKKPSHSAAVPREIE